MQVIANNLCVWVETVVHESVIEIEGDDTDLGNWFSTNNGEGGGSGGAGG